MRYELDGSGYNTSHSTQTKITAGCPTSGCIGYELMQDLDFNEPAHYRESANQAIWTVSDYEDNEDKGWLPIGDFANPFSARFNANRNTISNLQINRSNRDYAGLFGHIAENARLDEVGLLDINVQGRFVVGGLVGWNAEGEIVNSYVEGRVEGSETDGLVDSNWIGGMVGINDGLIINSYADADVAGNTAIGGLAGLAGRRSEIRNSYAISDVKGRNSVGGLVGVNQSNIDNSYAGGSAGVARGSVEPDHDIVYYVGGLVGYNDNEGMIMNSYAYSSVSGGVLSIGLSGGLVGFNLSDPNGTNIINSYWDRDASGIAFSSGSVDANGLSMEVIQSSVSFAGWLEANWSFGTTEEYPRLKYACEENINVQNCGLLLLGQGLELQSIGLRDAVLFPGFNLAVRSYAANVSAETTKVEVVAIASDRAELRVNGESVSSGEYKTIELDEAVTKINVVSESGQVTTYTIVVVRQAEEAAFVQSRFAGQPGDLVCRDCNPDADGAVRIRFAPQSLALLSNNSVISFKLQFRTIASAAAGHHISSAGFGLRYNPAAFGENLNIPVLDPYTMGMSQCTYERSDFFRRDNKYFISFSDTNVDELNIAEIGRDRNADPGQLNVLRTEWSDLVTMSCTIANQFEEAGLAIAGSNPRQIELRRYDDDGDAIPSLALLLADNDLRGLRLDGKTYVEDSTRYSDGSGVRLKFSKGVAVFAAASDGTQPDAMSLMPRNFSLDATADTVISTVTHIAGSAYAEIEFNEAVPSDILRLASTATYKIYAVDEGFVQGEELAHGNFAAALAYDANAPAVVDVEQVNAATWSLTFDKPIHPATVSKENLCLTNEMNVCADEVQGTSITAVSLMEEDKVLQVEIGSADQTERIAAIEFRRNAMLGADFRVVEGYQLELRDAITIADGVPPTITVKAMGAAMIQEDPPQTHTTITYSMSFTISANEAIDGLDDAASYRLLRLPNSDSGNPVPIIDPDVQTTRNGSDNVIVSYTGIQVSVPEVRNSRGFTLARANSMSLRDLSGKDPLSSDSRFLDSRGMADDTIALTGDLDDTAWLASLRLSAESETSALMPMFNPTTTTYRIMDVANATTYTTVSATAQNPAKISRIEVKSGTLEYNIEVDAVDVQSHRIPLTEGEETMITLVVTAQDDESEQKYIVVVERLPSQNVNLESLGIESASGNIALTPSFISTRTDYTAVVASDLSVTINAGAAHPQATVQIYRRTSTEDIPESDSGQVANATIALNLITTTTVIIRVTAQDGETAQDYIVAITRLLSRDASLASLGIASASGSIALDPEFASTRTDYTAEVSGDLSVRISAGAAHSQATIQIAKGAIAGDTPSVSGAVANAEIDLNLKTTTTVIIRVTAEDGETMQYYTIAVTRVPEADATLEALTIEGESVAGFDPAIAEYTVEVEGNLAIDLIAKATHDQAEIQIAGTSGVGQVSTRTQLNLATTTTIAIEVTSEDDANTREYTIAIIRLPSKDASLANIGITDAESGAVALLPGGFASTRTDYTAKVEDDLSVTINAGPTTHPQATVQIYERTSTEDIPKGVSGEVANATIGLNLKTTTTVVIRVTAEDGETTQNYIVALTRVPEADATLETLTIDGESVAGFDPAIAEYTVEVEGNLAIDLIAKATHDQAMIQIAGTSDVGEVSTRTQLNLGTTTTLVIEVESEDDANTREYTIAIRRLPSKDVSLASLRIANASGDITLTPVFDRNRNRTSYTAEVTGDLDVMVSAGATHPQAMVQIAKGAIAVDTRSFRGETASAAIDLNLGTVRTVTNVVVRVIAEDGTPQNYIVEITRLPSQNVNLESLEIASVSENNIALTPAFDRNINRTRYTAEVTGDLNVMVSAGATHSQASIQIAKGAIAEDTPSFRGETTSASIVLNLRIVTTVVIWVTAEDGTTTQDYTILITRLPSKDVSLGSLGIASASGSIALDPIFAADETGYTAAVESNDLSVTISAGETHSQASVQIAKGAIAEDTRSFRGETASATIDLNLEAGAVTTVVIRVTAEDGTTTQDYTILITRVPEADATLKALTIDGESVAGFDPATAEYTVVREGNLAIDINATATHDEAMVQIAGTSGVGQVSTRTQLNLATTTTLVIQVTSENGENTREYTVMIRRLPSVNVSLASLGIASASGNIALDPGFAADETRYTAEVADDLSVTISAEATHPQAAIQIAKEAIAGDTPSVSGEMANAAIDLNLKTTTTVIIRVTAENNTAQDYTILITRVPEADATLETLTIGGESVDGFDSAKEEYTVEVEGNLTIDLIAKATHNQAMIQIAGTSGVGQVSTQTQLNLATTTTLVIQVTSENGENTREYTIAIVRLPSSDAGLMSLEIVSAGTAGTDENIPLLPSGFSSTKTDYTAEVQGDSQILVTATTTHPQASIQVAIAEIMDDTPILQSGETSAVLELDQETTTTLVIRVTAEAGTPSQDYIVEISYVVGHIRIRTKIFLEGPLR